MTWTGVFQYGNLQLLNYYEMGWNLAYNPQTVNDRRTRGGPLSLNQPGYQVDVYANTDGRKAVVVSLSGGTYQSVQDHSSYVSASLSLRPASNVSLSVGPQYSWERTPVQYVTQYADSTATLTFGNRYVFAGLTANELSAVDPAQLDVHAEAVAAVLRPAADLGGRLLGLTRRWPARRRFAFRPLERRHLELRQHDVHAADARLQLQVAARQRACCAGSTCRARRSTSCGRKAGRTSRIPVRSGSARRSRASPGRGPTTSSWSSSRTGGPRKRSGGRRVGGPSAAHPVRRRTLRSGPPGPLVFPESATRNSVVTGRRRGRSAFARLLRQPLSYSSP